jgi:hypothetical protein
MLFLCFGWLYLSFGYGSSSMRSFSVNFNYFLAFLLSAFLVRLFAFLPFTSLLVRTCFLCFCSRFLCLLVRVSMKFDLLLNLPYSNLEPLILDDAGKQGIMSC